MRLKDNVAIITGAGQGIGEAYALRLGKEGATGRGRRREPREGHNGLTPFMAGACVPQEILDMIVNMMMSIERPLEPEDLTGTAVWLASTTARW